MVSVVTSNRAVSPETCLRGDVAAAAVLRRIPERAGLTSDQAAEASRISKAVLSRTKRGERPAEVTELLPLAAVLKMTAAELAAAIAADPWCRRGKGVATRRSPAPVGGTAIDQPGDFAAGDQRAVPEPHPDDDALALQPEEVGLRNAQRLDRLGDAE